MVQVTGTLEVKNGYIRVKPNVPFIGSLSGVSAYEINDGLVDIQLAPTPNDRVYLVDYTLSLDAAFLPTENWIVPEYDCDLNEVRGLITIHSRNLQLQVENLTLVNNQLQLSNNQLLLEISNLKLENSELQSRIKTLIPEEIHTDQKTLNSSSINILNRFL
jgi:hypothetical protein